MKSSVDKNEGWVAGQAQGFVGIAYLLNPDEDQTKPPLRIAYHRGLFVYLEENRHPGANNHHPARAPPVTDWTWHGQDAGKI